MMISIVLKIKDDYSIHQKNIEIFMKEVFEFMNNLSLPMVSNLIQV